MRVLTGAVAGGGCRVVECVGFKGLSRVEEGPGRFKGNIQCFSHVHSSSMAR